MSPVTADDRVLHKSATLVRPGALPPPRGAAEFWVRRCSTSGNQLGVPGVVD